MKNLIFPLTLLLLLVSCVGSPPTPEEMQNANFGPYPNNYEEIIKGYYYNVLFDPYSAVFRFLPPKKVGWGHGNDHYFGYAVCGGINAKNRFGAYVGEQLFFVIINSGQIILRYEKSNAYDACKQIFGTK